MIYMIGFVVTSVFLSILAIFIGWCIINYEICISMINQSIKSIYTKYQKAKMLEDINAPKSKTKNESLKKMFELGQFLDKELSKDNKFKRIIKRKLGIKLSSWRDEGKGLYIKYSSFCGIINVRYNGVHILKANRVFDIIDGNRIFNGKFELEWKEVILNNIELQKRYLKVFDDMFFLYENYINNIKKKQITSIEI